MASLSLDEIALKDRFLERVKRPDWTDEDFKGVMAVSAYSIDKILTHLRDLEHIEGISSDDLLMLNSLLAARLSNINNEISLRQIKVAGFSVMAASPLKRAAFKLTECLVAAVLGAILMYVAIHFPGA
jgi:hypothetical protein